MQNGTHLWAKSFTWTFFAKVSIVRKPNTGKRWSLINKTTTTLIIEGRGKWIQERVEITFNYYFFDGNLKASLVFWVYEKIWRMDRISYIKCENRRLYLQLILHQILNFSSCGKAKIRLQFTLKTFIHKF